MQCATRAIDVETSGETNDPRVAVFECAAIAPDGVVTTTIPRIETAERIAVHNMPYDPVVLGQPYCNWSDTKMIAAMAGVKDTSLKGMVRDILHRPAMTWQDAVRDGVLHGYNLWDAQNTLELEPVLLGMLRPDTLALYENLERPLFPLWAVMTMRGSYFLDRLRLQDYRDSLSERHQNAREQAEDLFPRGRTVDACQICHVYGEDRQPGQACLGGKNHRWVKDVFDPGLPINLASPAQLLKAFRDLGYDITSTEADVMERLGEQGCVQANQVLEVRGLAKELSTYIDPWLSAWPGRRIGGIWNPNGVWSGGRVSSRAFNMQNIPHHLDRFFREEEGYVILPFDNAQLEIRTAAAASQDEVLMNACATEDIHSAMMEEIGFTDRRLTKVWVFLTMYDGSPAEMVNSAYREGVTDKTVKDAQDAQASIKEKMPGWFRWREERRYEDVIDGLFGRVIYIPEGGDEYHKEKQRINAVPQAGGGDVTKWQMLALWKAGYRVLAQVHDSVVLGVPEKDKRDALVDVPRIMESAVELGVPLKVEYQPVDKGEDDDQKE